MEIQSSAALQSGQQDLVNPRIEYLSSFYSIPNSNQCLNSSPSIQGDQQHVSSPTSQSQQFMSIPYIQEKTDERCGDVAISEFAIVEEDCALISQDQRKNSIQMGENKTHKQTENTYKDWGQVIPSLNVMPNMEQQLQNSLSQGLNTKDLVLISQEDIVFVNKEDIALISKENIVFVNKEDIVFVNKEDLVLVNKEDIVLVKKDNFNIQEQEQSSNECVQSSQQEYETDSQSQYQIQSQSQSDSEYDDSKRNHTKGKNSYRENIQNQSSDKNQTEKSSKQIITHSFFQSHQPKSKSNTFNTFNTFKPSKNTLKHLSQSQTASLDPQSLPYSTETIKSTPEQFQSKHNKKQIQHKNKRIKKKSKQIKKKSQQIRKRRPQQRKKLNSQHYSIFNSIEDYFN